MTLRRTKIETVWSVALAVGLSMLGSGERARGQESPPAATQPAEKAPSPPPVEVPADAAPGSSTENAEKTIVFNFANSPWDAVLTRFAELADLSLVMEVKPAGTFSYSDQKPHTLSEAIDLLNGVLLAKDFIILRNDKFLTLVPLDRPLPQDMIPRLEPSQLDARGRNEMVTVSVPLQFAEPSKVYEQIKGVLSKHGTGVPLDQLKLLRLTDLAGHLREAIPLAQKIDEKLKPEAPKAPPPPAPPKVDRIYELKTLTVPTILPALKVVVAGAEFAEGPTPDKLVAIATESDQQKIADLLAKLDQPVAQGEQNVQQAYPLARAAADTLATSLQTIFPTEKTRAKFSGDRNSNVLLVDAAPSIQQQVKAILADLDKAPVSEQMVEKVYRPKSQSAAALLATLKPIYRASDATFSVDAAEEALVILATAAEQEQIAKLLADLDAQGEGTGQLTEMVIPLEHANAATLATSLTTLYPQAKTSCTFTSDAANNLLVVRCPASMEARIKSLVEQVDQPTGLGGNVELVYQPKHVKVASLVETLQQLYPTASNVRALPRPGGQSLLLSAPKQLLEKVKASLELLDAPTADGDDVLKIYRLTYSKADPLVTTLKTLFPADQLDATFIADVTNNQVIVSAPAEAQERIGTVIADLDIDPAADTVVEIYKPENISSAAMLETLRTIHGTASGARFSIDSRGRGILAVATPAEQKRIAATIAKLDAAPAEGETMAADELYKLKYAQAADLAETLRKLFPPEISDVKISHDAVNNVLIITAPENTQKKIQGLIERVDVPAESRLIEKIYTPKGQEVTTVLSTLQSLYNKDGKSVFSLTNGNRAIVALAPELVHKKITEFLAKLESQEDPNADLVQKIYRLTHSNPGYLAQSLQQSYPAATTRTSITPDPANNLLIVSATPEIHEKITALIESADQPATSALVEKIIKPQNVSVTALFNTLQSLFSGQQGTRMSMDAQGSSIIVFATPTMQDKVQQLATELDKPTDSAVAPERKIYALKHGTAYYAYSTLITLFPASESPGRFSYDSNANALIVIGPPQLQEKVKSLLAELDVDPRRDIVEKTYVPKNIPAAQLVTIMQQSLAQEPKTTITVGPDGAMIVILGPQSAQDRAAKLFETLDVPLDATAKVEQVVYPLKHATAGPVYTAMTILFPPSTTTGRYYLDQSANTIIVHGNEAFQAKIKELVEKMDVPAKGEVVEKLYTVKNASANEIAPLLRQTLATQPATTVTVTPNGQQILVLAPSDVQEKAAKALETLDAPLGEQAPTEMVYQIKSSSAGQIYSSLQNLYPPSVTGAKFSYDPTSNTVVVVAAPEVQEKIKKLIGEMDVPARVQSEQKIYAVKNVPAPQVATSLRQALATQPATTVTVTPDGQQILVVAPLTVHQKVDELLAAMDKAPAPEEVKKRELYRLKYADASQLAASLRALYPAADYPAMITHDSTNNVVIVDAPVALQESIAKLVADVDMPAGSRSEKVFVLENRKADQLLTALQTLLANSPGSRATAGPDNKSLIVIGAPKDLEIATTYIKQYDVPAPNEEVTRRLYRLRHAKSAALANSLQTLFANDPTARFTYEQPNNALVVIAKPEVHKQVEAMINEFDQPPQWIPMTEQVFSLKHASPSAVLSTLRQIFDDPDVAKFSADETSGTVLARTTTELAEKVRETVERVDQPRQQADREVEVVNLREIDPFSAENVIEGMFEELRPNDRPSVETVYDPPRIIVRASAEQMKEIRAVLSKMGEYIPVSGTAAEEVPSTGDAPATETAPRDAGRQIVRTIRLNAGDPRTVGEAIEKLWPRLRTNPLYLVTASGRVDEATELPVGQEEKKAKPVDQQKPPAQDEKTKDEPAPLTQPQANLPGNPKEPVIITPGVNRLLVSTKDPEALQLIEQLVDSLTEIPDFDQSEFTVFYLQTANAEDVAEAIDEAFNGQDRRGGDGEGRRRSSFQRDRVRVVADETANALIVRASPVDLLNVQRLIDSLDQAGLADVTNKEPRIIPLKDASADEVMQVLESVYKDYLAPGSGGPLNLPGFAAKVSNRGRTSAISVGVDVRSNSLIVAAPDFLFEQIESLVQSLQRAAADSNRTYRALPLRYSNPIEVRDALEILLDRDPTSGSSGGTRTRPPRRPTRTRRPSTPTSGRRSSGSQTSQAPSELPPEIETALEKIEPGETKPSATRVTTIRSGKDSVSVHDRRPQLLAPTGLAGAAAANANTAEDGPVILAAGFQEPAEEPAGLSLGAISSSVEIRALPDLGVILLLGSEKDLEELSAIVAEIERISQGRDLTFRLFPLQVAKAAPMAELMNDLYLRLLEARGTGTLAQSQAVIVPLAVPNALILAAPKDDIELLEDLARKFDVADAAAGQHKVVRLKHAQAEEAARTLNRFFLNRVVDGELAPEVLIEPDERSNSILVHAAPGDMAHVDGLIAELDVETTGNVNSMRVFPLRHTVAQEIARVLQNAIQGGTATTTTATARNQGGPSLQLLTPNRELKRTVKSGILENVRITPNERANTLIVSAPSMTMDLIEALITELDVLPEAFAEVKVFTLENSDALTMVQTLRNLFAQLQTPGGAVTVTAPTAAGAAGDGSSPLIDLTFSVDERTNSILASGSRQQLEVVEAIVVRLDASDIEERRTDVYRLRNANAITVATALTSLLEQQASLTNLTEGQSLQQQIEQEVVVVPEDVTNSLLISSTPRFYDKLLALIEKLDEPPAQVVIQVMIAQVDLENNEELGVELGLQDSVLFNRGIYPGVSNMVAPFSQAGVSNTAQQIPGIPGFNFNNQPLGNNPNVPGSGTVGSQGLGSFNLGRNSNLGYGGFVFSASSENVSILIRALAQNRRMEVLSRPQIMTLDNQEAYIQVGQQIPLITNSVIQSQGGVVNTFEYQSIGIILQVIPKINPDGSVIMRVFPEVSALAPITDVNSSIELSDGVFARAINTTRAETTVSANDGQTAVIGGLIRKEYETETRKVPYLGDIPYVGTLFRYDRRVCFKRELLIIMTPHVVRNEWEAQQVKEMEAARMNWCLQDIEKIQGPIGLPNSTIPSETVPTETISEGEDLTPVPDDDQSSSKWKLRLPFQKKEEKVAKRSDKPEIKNELLFTDVAEADKSTAQAVAGSKAPPVAAPKAPPGKPAAARIPTANPKAPAGNDGQPVRNATLSQAAGGVNEDGPIIIPANYEAPVPQEPAQPRPKEKRGLLYKLDPRRKHDGKPNDRQ